MGRDFSHDISSERPLTTQYLYATIAIDRSQSHLEKELTYGIPEELRSVLRIGFAVLVPVGRQTVTGYVTGFTNEIDFNPNQLRNIRQLISKAPLFDSKALQIARWMSAYYHCPLSDCIACYVPNGWQLATEKRYHLVATDWAEVEAQLSRAPRQLEIARMLHETGQPMTQKQLEKALDQSGLNDAIKKLMEQEIVTSDDNLLDPNMKPLRVQAVRLTEFNEGLAFAADAMKKTAPKQAEALQRLIEGTGNGPQLEPVATVRLAHDFGVDLPALRALEKKGFVEFSTIEQQRTPTSHLPPKDTNRVELTSEQVTAVNAIRESLDAAKAGDKSVPSTVLIQGVTASGKTEVYLSAIEHCLSLGRRAVVLVPEIALTAQTVEIFQRRFQERVAILHSALGAGERFDEWRRARAGRADIVVGARSAVFAPCRDVGLIIIDEEHDHSYKQDSLPRYHARDVAMKRAAMENAVLVLGSATPSLESYHRATRGDYRHIKMTQRIGISRLPEVEVVDMTQKAHMGSLPVLSQRLQDALCETVTRGEQAILFLNRRGFATYVQCLACGHVEHCPNCDVTLTFHRGPQSLRCHHCAYEAPVIETCPQCNGWMIGFTGTGTEKVEGEVDTLLHRRGITDVKTLRLDRDTTMRKGSHGKILGEFRQGHAQVLIGTQMVTKGLDFPRVTLVGVIAADTSLNMPDFRASERTFQLLSQVAGRAGRGDKPGRVLVQTLATEHYAIEAACAHDYEQFVELEIISRQSPLYPPFTHIVNIISHDENPGVAKARIDALALQFNDAIAAEGSGTELLGPVDCPISRVKGKYRFHLMLRDRNRPRLHRILEIYDALPRDKREGLTIDVDAMTIL